MIGRPIKGDFSDLVDYGRRTLPPTKLLLPSVWLTLRSGEAIL